MSVPKFWPDNPFWDFSLDVYSRGDVAEHLIALQENLGADINIMLYCYWVAYLGAPHLTEHQINTVVFVVNRWQREVVKPLRKMRTELKIDSKGGPRPWSDTIRTNIKIVELEAERLEQLMIYRAHSLEECDKIETWEMRRQANSNLVDYLKFCCREPNSEELTLIDILTVQIFP